jgi:hypothetical protein
MALTIEELAVIIHANHNEVYPPDLEGTVLALTVFQDVEPESVELIERHLTTGSSEFRAEIAQHVCGVLDAIHHTYTTIGTDWKMHCQFIIGHHFIEDMMYLWSYHHVSSYRQFNLSAFEAGRTMRQVTKGLDLISTESFVEYPVNYEDWTGIAALVCAGIDHRVLEDQQIVDFINYAGTHRNLAAVIDTAADRRIVHPETIEGLISQDEVMSVMRTGTL